MLLENAGEVLAIEKDARLVKFLRERFNRRTFTSAIRNQRLATSPELLHADALEFLKREQHDWSGWKLVANLPYSVASPILVELAGGARAPKKIVATLQLEVAQRLMAKAGDKDYGVLTLLVQLDFEPHELVQNSGGLFFSRTGCGFGLRGFGSPRRAAFAGIPTRRFCENCEARFFPAAENDAEIVARRLAGGKTRMGVCRIENLIAGTRGEIERGTIYWTDLDVNE